MYPQFLEIPYYPPEQAFARLTKHRDLIFFDSANHDEPLEKLNRYSYLCYDPIKRFVLKNRVLNGVALSTDPLHFLQLALKDYPLQKHPDLPPFQGGLAGCFSYDLCHYFESIPKNPNDPLHFPDLAVGIYDAVIAFDHLLKKAWIVSTGYPCREEHERGVFASQRLEKVKADLSESPFISEKKSVSVSDMKSDCSATDYENRVNKAIDYILNGDIFEINLSQRFQIELEKKELGLALYLKLREINPAPFGGYLRFDDFTLASASPERFLQVSNRCVETRPIKGTTATHDDPIINEENKKKLLSSAKDRAENVMIVDLMRNDLSRVCKPESVVVEKLCALESFATVHHLVSVVCGELMLPFDSFDLLRAAFPGGSITGAPKIRAMELINELEGCTRGPHFGSLGYISFSGDMDTSILIRSFAIQGKTATLQTGGAIVLNSIPKEEYTESLLKASRCQEALK